MIWMMFNGDIPQNKVIHHLDHDPSNNSLTNLEMTDQSGNMSAAHDAGQYDGGKTQRRPIIIDGIKYTSGFDAARKLNPDITDKKKLASLRVRYVYRCHSINFPGYMFV